MVRSSTICHTLQPAKGRLLEGLNVIYGPFPALPNDL